MGKMQQISNLDSAIQNAQKEQVSLAAEVVIEAIKSNNQSNMLQLIGSLTNSTASMSDLLIAIRDKLSGETNDIQKDSSSMNVLDHLVTTLNYAPDELESLIREHGWKIVKSDMFKTEFTKQIANPLEDFEKFDGLCFRVVFMWQQSTVKIIAEIDISGDLDELVAISGEDLEAETTSLSNVLMSHDSLGELTNLFKARPMLPEHFDNAFLELTDALKNVLVVRK